MAYVPPKKRAGRQAVLEAMADHPAIQAILAADSEALVDACFDHDELSLTLAREQLIPATEALRSVGYLFFEDMTAVDWFPAAPRFQLSYHFLSFARKERIRLHAWVDEAAPVIASITPHWPSANYFEREVFDLFGIRFEGHPNLRRIMLPDDWQGHPLRKNYPVEGYR